MGVADHTDGGILPVPVDMSPVKYCQTLVSLPTLSLLIWVRGEYFCELSWPWKLSHSLPLGIGILASSAEMLDGASNGGGTV